MLGSNLNIMAPQWLDVVFKDRNQAYGAYTLRKDNAYNTNRSLIIAASLFVVALSLPTLMNKIHGLVPPKDIPVKIVEVDLKKVEILKEKIQPPVVEPQRQVRSAHDVIKFPPPVVRPDVNTHEDPPTNKEIEKADVGQQNMKGDPMATDIVIDERVGPKDVAGVTESSPDIIFNAVEINPEYPGGESAFNKFLSTHIRYPSVAKENGVQGRVFVQFVVERDGSLTDMKILHSPGSGLGEEAVRVLKSSLHWTPGMQNGKPVRVQYTVPVNFALAE